MICDSYSAHEYADVRHMARTHSTLALHFRSTAYSRLNLVKCLLLGHQRPGHPPQLVFAQSAISTTSVERSSITEGCRHHRPFMHRAQTKTTACSPLTLRLQPINRGEKCETALSNLIIHIATLVHLSLGQR